MNERAWGMAGNKLSTWRKTCSSANTTTTNSTRNGLMSKHGLPSWVIGRQGDYQVSSIKFNPAEVSAVDTYAHNITKVQTYYFIVSASFTALICTLHQTQILSEINDTSVACWLKQSTEVTFSVFIPKFAQIIEYYYYYYSLLLYFGEENIIYMSIFILF